MYVPGVQALFYKAYRVLRTYSHSTPAYHTRTNPHGKQNRAGVNLSVNFGLEHLPYLTSARPATSLYYRCCWTCRPLQRIICALLALRPHSSSWNVSHRDLPLIRSRSTSQWQLVPQRPHGWWRILSATSVAHEPSVAWEYQGHQQELQPPCRRRR